MRRWFVLFVMFVCLLPAFSALADERKEIEHYLLVGVDGWGLNTEGGARSDAIILASLDYERDRITFTSFARDCIVKPAHRKGTVKLNTLVRSEEGEQVLIQYLEDAFSIPISGYFVINFTGAVYVIDAVGGVDIELSQAEADYVNHHAGAYEDYPLSEGLCRMSGGQAIYYMRCRSLDNDFGRQGRQGKVLRALADELSDITLTRALLLVDDMLGLYRTSLGVGGQVKLAMKMLSLRDAQVRTYSLPAEGTFHYGRDSHGTSGLEFNLEENRQMLFDLLEIPVPALQSEENKSAAAS